MDFNEKLQLLRYQKGLTQEELAEILYVSRTAVSKWESGRGYPNIDSLKAISRFFGITIDELLSGDELLTLAEEDTRQKRNYFCNLVFGLLDICMAMFFFLPLFRQTVNGSIREVSLPALSEVSCWLRVVYFSAVIAIVAIGVFALATLKHQKFFRVSNKISLFINAVGILVFIISPQPYAAAFMFAMLIIKALLFIKRQ